MVSLRTSRAVGGFAVEETEAEGEMEVDFLGVRGWVLSTWGVVAVPVRRARLLIGAGA